MKNSELFRSHVQNTLLTNDWPKVKMSNQRCQININQSILININQKINIHNDKYFLFITSDKILTQTLNVV